MRPALIVARILLPLAGAWLGVVEARWLLASGGAGDPLTDAALWGSVACVAFAIGLTPWRPLLSALLFLLSLMLGIALNNLTLVGFAIAPVAAAVTATQRWRGIAAMGALTTGGIVLASAQEPRLLGPILIGVLGLFGVLLGLGVRATIESRRRHAARLRAVEAELAQTRAQEREALARQLHDLVGHSLSTVALQAEAWRDSVDVAELQAALTLIRRESVAGVNQMRALVGLLRDDSPESEDQQAALADLGHRVATNLDGLGFQTTLRIDPRVALLDRTRIAFCRHFIAEAATNMQRHATPGPCLLRIDCASEVVAEAHSLLPTPSPTRTGRGHGINDLTELAALTGGRVQYGPVQNQWRLLARLPLPGPTEPGADPKPDLEETD